MNTKWTYIFGFVLLAILWGGSFLAIRFSIDTFPPFSAAAMRVGIATALMFVFMKLQKAAIPNDPSLIWQLLGIGFFTLGLPWALLFWGEQFVSPAMGSILNSTTPLFVVIVTALFTSQENVKWNKWLGVAVGFAGVIIIFGPKIVLGHEQNLFGMLAIVGMAICYAIGIVWLKSLAHKTSASVAFFLQGSGALLFLVPLTLLAEWTAIYHSNWSSINGWTAVIYLGVFSTAIAQLIFFVLLRELGSVKAAAVTYFIPIVAVTLDWLVSGKFLSVSSLIGALVVLVGVRLIHMRTPDFSTLVPEEAIPAVASED